MHPDRRIFEEPLQRAEIVIYDIDTSSFSYEGRVFLNNRDADQKTPLSPEHGYVGSYFIFGYSDLFFDMNCMSREANMIIDRTHLQLPNISA
jgi:hypothetical protein